MAFQVHIYTRVYIPHTMSTNYIPVTINKRLHLVPQNFLIIQACEQAFYNIPRFCYHEKLKTAGNCRMCVVEVLGGLKPVISCTNNVNKNMILFTLTPTIKKARESTLEFLLINHPLDCPICDQGGECDLQDETLHYGSDRSRYFFSYKRSIEDKDLGPIIKTIMTRCIHCTRCVRFCMEVLDNGSFGVFSRGETSGVGTYVKFFSKSELSGNLVDLCPVGQTNTQTFFV